MTSIRLLRGASRQFALSGLLIGVVLLMGCASASDPVAEPPAEPIDSILANLDPSEPVDPSELDEEVIDELAVAYRGPTPLHGFFEAHTCPEKSQLQYEEEISTRMVLEGFDYIAVVYETPTLVRQLGDEYVVNALLGYGISTLWGREPIQVPNNGKRNRSE